MVASDISAGIGADLDYIRGAGLFRKRRVIKSPQGAVVTVDNQRLVNFCSNDYLGFANDDRLIRALQQAAETYGVGSGASQLVCGRSSMHADLETELARITGRDRAVVFSSGYLANLSLARTLCPGRTDLIIVDRLSHASMIDAARLSPAVFKRYRHADPVSLEQQLNKWGQKRKLVLTDSVFSMDGDVAPLPDIVKVCRQARACLVVDDAHGFGVLGKSGRGALEYFDLGQEDVPLLMATFGKALGVFGAFIAGQTQLIELLIQRARTYIYTTALPPALAATALMSLRLLDDEPWRREHLQTLIKRFQEGAVQLGLPILPSSTPIQPLMVGSASAAVKLSDKLFQQGFFISAIRPPSVPNNTARLRITLSAAHTEEQIDHLLDALLETVAVK
ncbi:MAG: 8-amino-7-oxononanoate synthase [Gammaproteobacteria bacterium]|nr:8-amino-7-oxononanoate synthase [Gammaproteobacteria bacterium]